MPKREIGSESTEGLRLEYLMAAAYYWYKAEGNDEQLVCALQRVRAQNLSRKLQNHLPTPEEVRAYAVGRFPAHRLHGEL